MVKLLLLEQASLGHSTCMCCTAITSHHIDDVNIVDEVNTIMYEKANGKKKGKATLSETLLPLSMQSDRQFSTVFGL